MAKLEQFRYWVLQKYGKNIWSQFVLGVREHHGLPMITYYYEHKECEIVTMAFPWKNRLVEGVWSKMNAEWHIQINSRLS